MIEIVKTHDYILVRDTREMKKRAIPNSVIAPFESRLQFLSPHPYPCQEYAGIAYLLLPKTINP